MNKTLNIIACCDNRMGIGNDNELPWNISSEIKLFKEKTIGNGNNCVIMGKNTYLSIPENYRPLGKRYNCIVSSTYTLPDDCLNCEILSNLNKDLLYFLDNTNYDKYWIIGGSRVYYEIMTHCLHLLDEIHISILNDDYECNKYFPIINGSQFTVKFKRENEKDNYTHYVYKKKKKI